MLAEHERWQSTRRRLLTGGAAMLTLAATASRSWAASAFTESLNELGTEGHALATRAGTWDVEETIWDSPDAKPVVAKGRAVRRMIGPLLEETLWQTDSASNQGSISRIDYLSFNRVEGRWNYVSMDVRVAVGIMTANSFDRDPPDKIQVVFNPFALPGETPSTTGLLLRMDQSIETLGADTDRKLQHFIVADGSGRKWLAHRYDYQRRQT